MRQDELRMCAALRLDDVGLHDFRGIEFAILDCLQADERRNGDDVIHFCSARHVGCGSRKSQENLPEHARSADVLNKLCSDVAAVEFGKDQNVGFPADGARSHLALGDFGNERRVRLHLAIHCNLHAELVGQLADNGNRPGNLFGGRGLGASLGGEAQHGNAWTCSEDLPRHQASLHRDRGELLDVRVGHNTAVRQEEHAIIARISCSELRPQGSRK